MDTRIRIIAEDLTKQGADALERLISLEKELKAEAESLKVSMINNSNSFNNETTKQIGIIKTLQGDIQRLTSLRNESNNTTQIASYNKQIGLQENELRKLTDTQQKTNVLTKEQNAQINALTGTTGKSNSMFRDLAVTMGALFAVDRIIGYSKSMIENIVNTQRFDIVLRNVSSSNEEYNQSLEFLNKTSEKYGQNINILKDTYSQFIAASKSSNLSLTERQKIYESIIQSGSTLKLSNDAIQGSLLAVSQMFSKGNVSAEELRGQLGERLPGAFGIMAKALGVNETKLNKMLEQGEVLAKDALPKFAKALTETYGEKAQQNLETVGGQQNRVINSLTNYLSKKNEDLGITNKITAGYKFLADNLGLVVNGTIGLTAAVGAYILKQTISGGIDQIKLLSLGREVLAKQAASTVTLELTAAETAAAAAATRFNLALAAAPWAIVLVGIGAGVAALMEYSDAQQRAYEMTEAGIKATDTSIKSEKQHSIELGISIEQAKKLMEGTNERTTAVKKLMAQYPQYFNNLTAEQVSNWHLENAYRQVNKEIATKITLMAREKSIEKQTNRLTEIKMELESMGVYVNTLKEFNNQEKERGLHINLQGPKTHALLKEQDKLTANLIESSGKLGTAQINQANVELNSNKAKYNSKQISLLQFKEEVNRINETYHLGLKKYEMEKVEIPKVTEAKKKGDKEKSISEEELYNEYLRLKTEFESKIKKFDEDYTKWLFDEHQKRAKIETDAVNDIEKNIEKTKLDSQKSISSKYLDSNKDLNDRIKKGVDEIQDKQKESDIEWIKGLEKKQKNFETFINIGLDTMANAVDELYAYFDKKSKEGETSAERQGAALNKAFLDPMKENINAAKALMSGDFVGAAKGLFGYFEGMWKTTIGLKNTLNEIKLNEFNLQWESTMSNLESYSEAIKENFKGLVDSSVEFNATQKTGVDALISAEIKRAGQIRDTYEMSLSKEDELYNKRIKSINDEYTLKDALANRRFDADSLLIQESLNKSLFALLTNEESKTSLTSEYAGKRSFILNQFALADSDITDKTTQAEIDAINQAIEARTKALSELEQWYTTELEFTVNSEEQKRKEYTATAQLIKDASDAQNQLDIQFTADSIQREKDKQLEIESELARHNDELKTLSEMKDAAILASFNALKEAMVSGYAEILASASDAYSKGIITAEQYLSKLKEIQELRGLLTTPNFTNDIKNKLISLEIQGFNTGTELVGGNRGIDKNLALLSHDEAVLESPLNLKRLSAGLNRKQTVDYAINYKNLLSGNGFVPLEIRDSVNKRLDEVNSMKYLSTLNLGPVVEELKDVKNALSKIPINNFSLDENGLQKWTKKGNSVVKFKSKRFD